MIRRAGLTAAMLVLIAPFVLRAAQSHAHAVGLSRGEYRSDGAEVHADLVFARKELMMTFPRLDADRDGDLSDDEIGRGRDAFSDWIGRGVLVRVSTGQCTGTLREVALTERDGIAFAAVYQCPQPATTFAIRLALLAELSIGHRHLLAAASASQTASAVLHKGESEFELAVSSSAPGEPNRVGFPMLRLGLEHILTGYDHLLFVFALILVGGPLRSLFGAITAFTLAHSITLAVAALGVWTPHPNFVEPAIALSIVFVGMENCITADLRGRWRLTFAFGLVHGFGFAGALAEVALPAAQLPLALASFNVGVELGQLAVVSLVLPLVWWLGRRAWFASGGLHACSIAISAMGLWWFVARVTGG